MLLQRQSDSSAALRKASANNGTRTRIHLLPLACGVNCHRIKEQQQQPSELFVAWLNELEETCFQKKHPWRSRLLVSLFVGVFNLAWVQSTAASDRLNILLLYADDWRHDTLGAAGNPTVSTPHLDRLSDAGVRFTHNSVTTAICGVSRASLLTGQWMSRHGCRAFERFDTPWKETFPGRLRDNGYHVGHVGKWHNGRFPKKDFDEGVAYHGKHWYPSKEGRIHVTERNEQDAMRFLRDRPAGQAFCLTVAFFAPHAEDSSPSQYEPQDWSAEAYEGVDIPRVQNNTLESWQRLPPFFNEENEGRRRWRRRFDTQEKARTMMTNYYRLVTEVDRACGTILDEIDRQGIRDETLVIFTSDNGYFHGEHGLADKWYPHQESLRVPLIIDDPRLDQSDRGSTRDELTLNVDLAATILSAAGLESPTTMQGKDLAALYLEGDASGWRQDFFYEHPTLRSTSFIPASEALVSRRWKYMLWPEHHVEQLFDLASDVHEERDISNDPKSDKRLDAMRQRFAELKERAR